MADRAGSTDSFKPRRDEEDVEMDITPMIDIVFLLLAFFVVSSKMQEQAALPIPIAKNGSAVAGAHSIVLGLDQESPESDARVFEGKDYTEGKGYLLDEDAEERVIQYITKELNSGEKKYILLNISGHVRNKNTQMLAKFVSKAIPEDKDIQIHEAVNEGQ